MKKLSLFILIFFVSFSYSQDLPVTGEFNLTSMTDLSTDKELEVEGTVTVNRIFTMKTGDKEINLDLESIMNEFGNKIKEENTPLGQGYIYQLLITRKKDNSTLDLVLIKSENDIHGSFQMVNNGNSDEDSGYLFKFKN